MRCLGNLIDAKAKVPVTLKWWRKYDSIQDFNELESLVFYLYEIFHHFLLLCL